MDTASYPTITIETLVKTSVEKVWTCWTEPKHITQWNQASNDWHAPYSENDLRTGGKFKTTMAAKDGSVSFDFEGIYTKIQQLKVIEYTIADGRKVSITFAGSAKETKVVESFEAENANPIEIQRGGWQAILDSFKKYIEELG